MAALTVEDEAPVSRIAPSAPDAPGVPFPHVADDAYDAELEAIGETRDRPAAMAVQVVRLLSIAVAIALAVSLRHDLRFAFVSRTPVVLGIQASSGELDGASNRYVEIRGVPGGVGAVEYRRPLGEGLYRLAPLVDRPDVYVELRIPDGTDPTRYVPPTTVRGRLVPLDEAGARFHGVRHLLASALGRRPAEKAWLVEQVEPSLRSPGAMVALLALVIGAAQLSFALGSRRRPHPPATPTT